MVSERAAGIVVLVAGILALIGLIPAIFGMVLADGASLGNDASRGGATPRSVDYGPHLY